ncbi:CACTA en-spm transposon protein [Cucumis melo var. makuwa]|uniref:CACTA en-spm transposon protein n=1 Tax=Cucumis melo var. makuwa TaxID=1194695 RepID=A0A5D3CIL9_CUCMM|nr:CACTA en-spm transposon protein [Cucumis melo var. makuwa]
MVKPVVKHVAKLLKRTSELPQSSTRNRDFPDAKKNVGTKNVGNKGILDVGQTRRESRIGENPIPDARIMHREWRRQAIGVCVRKTFPVRYLKWADVDKKYIEAVKGNLQQFFVLDFNDQAMNRFVEHQMLTTFKEFQTDCHRHFKKYSDLEEARANPPNTLVGRYEDWHFLCDHYMSRALLI